MSVCYVLALQKFRDEGRFFPPQYTHVSQSLCLEGGGLGQYLLRSSPCKQPASEPDNKRNASQGVAHLTYL